MCTLHSSSLSSCPHVPPTCCWYFQPPRISRSSEVGLPEFHLRSWLWAKGMGWRVWLWSLYAPFLWPSWLVVRERSHHTCTWSDSCHTSSNTFKAFLLGLCLYFPHSSVPSTAGSISWLRQPMSCDRDVSHAPVAGLSASPCNRVGSPITTVNEILLLIHKRSLS